MEMTPDHPNAASVKATLDALMSGVSGHSFEVLDQIYHADMQTYLLVEGGQLIRNDKPGFMQHVKDAMAQMKDPNPWAHYHLVEANDTHGHVLVSRKNNVTNRKQLVTLSIDFVRENDRWQITREVIMTRNDEA